MKWSRIFAILLILLVIGAKAYLRDYRNEHQKIERETTQKALNESLRQSIEKSQSGAHTVTARAKDDSILEEEENAGGHLLSRHVGKTETELKDRLDHSRITAASSFTDMATAESVTAETIEKNQAKIQNFLKGNQERIVLYYRGKNPIGITISRGDERAKPAYNAKFVLVRDSSEAKGYHIITGYPAP